MEDRTVRDPIHGLVHLSSDEAEICLVLGHGPFFHVSEGALDVAQADDTITKSGHIPDAKLGMEPFPNYRLVDK